jgi:uncharacterized protein YdhG (YjbR/CyaY superfamily)
MDAGHPDVDAYIAAVRPAHRAALHELRRLILRAVPGADQVIRRGVPAFRHQGRPLVSIGAATRHVSLYVMQGNVLRDLAEDLAPYDATHTVVRFDPRERIPGRLVHQIVTARASEIAADAP